LLSTTTAKNKRLFIVESDKRCKNTLSDALPKSKFHLGVRQFAMRLAAFSANREPKKIAKSCTTTSLLHRKFHDFLHSKFATV